MDCLEGMKQIADKSVDMVLCDLPYGVTRCRWDNPIPVEPLWEQYKRIIKDNGAIVLTAVQPFASRLVTSNPDMFRYEWIWEKPHAKGHMNAGKQPMKAHENVLVFYRKQPVYNPQMTYGHKRKVCRRKLEVSREDSCYGNNTRETIYDSTTRYPRSVQVFSNGAQNGKIHPTQKPVELFRYFILTYTNPDALVLDNCMGSGTTAIACMETGRSFIGFEKDHEYYDLLNRRIKEYPQMK